MQHLTVPSQSPRRPSCVAAACPQSAGPRSPSHAQGSQATLAPAFVPEGSKIVKYALQTMLFLRDYNIETGLNGLNWIFDFFNMKCM